MVPAISMHDQGKYNSASGLYSSNDSKLRIGSASLWSESYFRSSTCSPFTGQNFSSNSTVLSQISSARRQVSGSTPSYKSSTRVARSLTKLRNSGVLQFVAKINTGDAVVSCSLEVKPSCTWVHASRYICRHELHSFKGVVIDYHLPFPWPKEITTLPRRAPISRSSPFPLCNLWFPFAPSIRRCLDPN